jgi:hypothetical protein
VLETGITSATKDAGIIRPDARSTHMELEEGGLRVTLIKAVVKAVQRAKELAFS